MSAYSLLGPMNTRPYALGERPGGSYIPSIPLLSGQAAWDSLSGYYSGKHLDTAMNPITRPMQGTGGRATDQGLFALNKKAIHRNADKLGKYATDVELDTFRHDFPKTAAFLTASADLNLSEAQLHEGLSKVAAEELDFLEGIKPGVVPNSYQSAELPGAQGGYGTSQLKPDGGSSWTRNASQRTNTQPAATNTPPVATNTPPVATNTPEPYQYKAPTAPGVPRTAQPGGSVPELSWWQKAKRTAKAPFKPGGGLYNYNKYKPPGLMSWLTGGGTHAGEVYSGKNSIPNSDGVKAYQAALGRSVDPETTLVPGMKSVRKVTDDPLVQSSVGNAGRALRGGFQATGGAILDAGGDLAADLNVPGAQSVSNYGHNAKLTGWADLQRSFGQDAQFNDPGADGRGQAAWAEERGDISYGNNHNASSLADLDPRKQPGGEFNTNRYAEPFKTNTQKQHDDAGDFLLDQGQPGMASAMNIARDTSELAQEAALADVGLSGVAGVAGRSLNAARTALAVPAKSYAGAAALAGEATAAGVRAPGYADAAQLKTDEVAPNSLGVGPEGLVEGTTRGEQQVPVAAVQHDQDGRPMAPSGEEAAAVAQHELDPVVAAQRQQMWSQLPTMTAEQYEVTRGRLIEEASQELQDLHDGAWSKEQADAEAMTQVDHRMALAVDNARQDKLPMKEFGGKSFKEVMDDLENGNLQPEYEESLPAYAQLRVNEAVAPIAEQKGGAAVTEVAEAAKSGTPNDVAKDSLEAAGAGKTEGGIQGAFAAMGMPERMLLGLGVGTGILGLGAFLSGRGGFIGLLLGALGLGTAGAQMGMFGEGAQGGIQGLLGGLFGGGEGGAEKGPQFSDEELFSSGDAAVAEAPVAPSDGLTPAPVSLNGAAPTDSLSFNDAPDAPLSFNNPGEPVPGAAPAAAAPAAAPSKPGTIEHAWADDNIDAGEAKQLMGNPAMRKQLLGTHPRASYQMLASAAGNDEELHDKLMAVGKHWNSGWYGVHDEVVAKLTEAGLTTPLEQAQFAEHAKYYRKKQGHHVDHSSTTADRLIEIFSNNR